MTPQDAHALLEKWLEGRPAIIRQLALEFPPGTRVEGHDGRTWYVLGWTEDGKLVLSRLDPVANYEAAANGPRVRVCADHYRTPRV